jgi:ABC-type transport system substrate-binding protein
MTESRHLANESALLKATQSELDPKKRLALLQNLLAVHQGNAPNLSLIETQDVMGYSPRVRNFRNVNLKINYATVEIVE